MAAEAALDGPDVSAAAAAAVTAGSDVALSMALFAAATEPFDVLLLFDVLPRPVDRPAAVVLAATAKAGEGRTGCSGANVITRIAATTSATVRHEQYRDTRFPPEGRSPCQLAERMWPLIQRQ